jgi:adenosylcobinamide-GDP ribazoletransferase
MRSFLLALSFLTVLPISVKGRASGEEMSRSLGVYPLVGLTLGALLVPVAWWGVHLQLGPAGDVLTILVLVFLTGGLHLDGLMDTSDAVFSRRSREQMLEIMKDSGVGAMGVLAAFSVLSLKISLLSLFPWPLKAWYLLVMPALGRWSFVYCIVRYPYARSSPGLGSSYDRSTSRVSLALATVLLLAMGLLCTGCWGLFPLAGGVIWVLLAAGYLSRVLGGLTGDTYGAVGETVEVVYLMLAHVMLAWR